MQTEENRTQTDAFRIKGRMLMTMPRASYAQKAERLNRARILLRQGDPLSDAVQRLAQDCSLSPRQAYRYLTQAQHLKEPVPRGEAKLAFTVKLSHRLIQRVRVYAKAKRLSISEVVSRWLLVQLPRGGTCPGSATAPGTEKAPVVLDLVETLASIGCTLEEIGAVVGVSPRTLIRREEEETFREAIERGRGRARVSVRRALWKSAMAGNVTAMIWLGKRMLGQRSYEREEKNKADTAVPPLIIQTYQEERSSGRKALKGDALKKKQEPPKRR
jgi:hypothetical protein